MLFIILLFSLCIYVYNIFFCCIVCIVQSQVFSKFNYSNFWLTTGLFQQSHNAHIMVSELVLLYILSIIIVKLHSIYWNKHYCTYCYLWIISKLALLYISELSLCPSYFSARIFSSATRCNRKKKKPIYLRAKKHR